MFEMLFPISKGMQRDELGMCRRRYWTSLTRNLLSQSLQTADRSMPISIISKCKQQSMCKTGHCWPRCHYQQTSFLLLRHLQMICLEVAPLGTIFSHRMPPRQDKGWKEKLKMIHQHMLSQNEAT